MPTMGKHLEQARDSVYARQCPTGNVDKKQTNKYVRYVHYDKIEYG